jgi:transcriptional regulator with PAS, ATPase and Fis domain
VVNKVVYVVDAKGQRIPISISTAVLKDAKGKVVGGVESFRDLRVVEELHRQAQEQNRFADIIGRSAPMRRIFEILPAIAGSDSTVLIEGASGTGKELFARAIHNMSKRRAKKLVAINCGALPDTLLESELFGYKAGAFTDARRDKAGRFALAEGGTIFLDEIGDVSPAMQTRLLRVLQERVYEPLGSVDSVKANVRVITATNKSLDQLVREGTFREDLFYRVHVVRLELPSVRDRREDIPLLIDHFVAQFNCRQGKDICGVSDEVLARLMDYDFPGNVRELENIIEHAFVLCRGGLIKMQHLPPHLRPASTADNLPKGKGMTLQAVEEMVIREALRRNQGNKTRAAKEMGIDASTLFRKIKTLKLESPRQISDVRKSQLSEVGGSTSGRRPAG